MSFPMIIESEHIIWLVFRTYINLHMICSINYHRMCLHIYMYIYYHHHHHHSIYKRGLPYLCTCMGLYLCGQTHIYTYIMFLLTCIYKYIYICIYIYMYILYIYSHRHLFLWMNNIFQSENIKVYLQLYWECFYQNNNKLFT